MVAQAGGQGSLIGATIGGFEVVALIGRGAMGAVYLARDVKLNRLVALKVLLGSLAKSPSLVKQFHQEAQASAPLNHPSIVRVYSAGIESGTPYIAMEYVEGEPLDRFLKRKGKVKWDVALHIGYKLAQGLECAHNAGVIHRDIKPSNIMLDQTGGTRLTDFGIAKIQSDDNASSPGQSFLGTPQYMSPEQAKNGNIGPSSDLYSLGVTLYQMISSELPFKGESTISLINSICNDEAPRLNKIVMDVPDDVARFVAYLLGKTPADRPANAKVAYSMMQRLQNQRGTSTSTSDGLSEFIQGEMEIRAFETLSHKPTSSRKNAAKDPSTARLSGIPSRNPILLRAAAIVLVGIGAFVLPSFTMSQASVDTELTVPATDALKYRKLDKVVDVYQLPSEAYEFSSLRWISNVPVVWLEVQGIPGSATHDSIGVLGVNVLDHSSTTLAPPEGPTTPDFDPVYRNALRSASVIQLPDDHPLHNRFLVSGIEAKSNDVVVLARAWDKTYADPSVILRTPKNSWVLQQQDDPLRPLIGSAIPNPNGKTICYLMIDTDFGHNLLIEQSLEDDTWLQLSAPRTNPGSEIIPGAVQFTPDGAHIIYLRERSIGGAELWRLSSGGNEQNGQLLITGVHDNIYSINPKGDTILLTLDSDNTSKPSAEIALVQIHTKNVRRLGPGRVSQYAWHPTEPYFVTNQAPPRNVDPSAISSGDSPELPMQLIAIRSNAVDKQVAITDIKNGITPSYAISQDGRFVSAIAQDASAPSMLVVNWDALDLDSTP